LQDADTAARIICIFGILKVLKLHKESKELVETFNNIDINLEKGFNSLVALGELVHAGEVDWVALKSAILLSQDLSVTTDDITSVLFEKAYKTQVELSMALDSISVVLDSLDELTLLDIHGLHAETVLLLLQLIVHDFLEAHALKAEHAHEAVIFTLVRHNVIGVHAIVVKIELVEDHIAGRAHLLAEVDRDVLEPQMTSNVDWGSAKLISLSDECKDLALTELRRALLEQCRDFCNCSCIYDGEKTIAV